MVRKPPFIEYFIRRKNSLPEMGAEIEFIAANFRSLAKAHVPKWTEFLMGIPVALVPPTNRKNRRPAEKQIFLVKRKDTRKHEPWLEDYLECPSPDWHLMGVLNRERANRAAALRRALERISPAKQPWNSG